MHKHVRQTWDTKLWFLSLVEETKGFQPRILSRFFNVGWESSSDSKPEEIRDNLMPWEHGEKILLGAASPLLLPKVLQSS